MGSLLNSNDWPFFASSDHPISHGTSLMFPSVTEHLLEQMLNTVVQSSDQQGAVQASKFLSTVE